jgi:phosphatidylinositol glycan class M
MRLDSISRTTWVLAGLTLRIALLGWGAYQDSTSAVPYTDIDYHVFTSAARHVVSACPLDAVVGVSAQEEYSDLQDPPQARGSCAQGYLAAASRFVLQAEPTMVDMSNSSSPEISSEPPQLGEKLLLMSLSLLRPVFRFLAGLGNPYKRDTYRYTPLLAVLLAPGEVLDNQWSSAFFGKSLFILADVIVALLMWDIMDLRRTQRSTTQNDSWLAGLLWLCNPFTAQISTRGSSESVLGVLVLTFLDMTLRNYPERNLLVEVESNGKPVVTSSGADVGAKAEVEEDTKWNNSALMAPFIFALSIHWKLYPIIYAAALVPHLITSESMRGVIRFGAIAIYSLACISIPVWAIWGPPYLDQTLFYHFYRSDHRHNFSPHFLSAYLASSPLSSITLESWPSIFSQLVAMSSSLSFVPQLGLTAYLGFSMGAHDLVAAMTFQTMAFVAFNKVCTSQYYMWIIWFLPIVAPFLHFKDGSRSVITLVSTWVLAQVGIIGRTRYITLADILLPLLSGHLAVAGLLA